MATIISRTIGSGGDYATIADWAAAIPADLVTAGEIWKGILIENKNYNETIDLTGSGDNTLTLDVTDVLAISDESNDLFVNGDAGDQVTASGTWQNDGPVTVDGVTYTVYSVSGTAAALYVEDGVVFSVAATTGV